MTATVVVGAQWGDEGKAKIIDHLADHADVIVRYQGGCNAGHTVVHEGQTYKFHLIPSGVLYADKTCVIGSGTVILPTVFAEELKTLQAHGISDAGLKVSQRAHLTLPFHLDIDKAKEAARGDKSIGTTLRGIGPTMEDKVGRAGLRVGDLFADEAWLRDRVAHLADMKNPVLTKVYNLPAIEPEALFETCLDYRRLFQPYVCDTEALLAEALRQGQHLLMEGAQGSMLDLDHGTYPYVTSSNPVSGGACAGGGVPPTALARIIGVTKAYTTRVGGGPYPTELFDEAGRHLADVGHEFGTTTGRARRCGWFDAVALRYAAQVNGFTELALTKLDVLSGLQKVALCTAYRHKTSGERVVQFPAQIGMLDVLEPVLEWFEGWPEDISGCRSVDELPEAARRFVSALSQHCGVPVGIISVGQDRRATICAVPAIGSQNQLSGLTSS
ncbi:MAG: adenylosuccinate synthase [Cyanobacteria bacterium HKST-UBA06]|nr:adenylosuccinate synthase [Cyanobacteria bacterium HKST-UBA04]MCA9807538.1 adenylosuccinate synthase [Cyanobacteria bacterium HKST-UBA06]